MRAGRLRGVRPTDLWQRQLRSSQQRVRSIDELRKLRFGRVLQRAVLHPGVVRKRARRRTRDELRSGAPRLRDHQVVRALPRRRGLLEPQVHRVRRKDVRRLCECRLQSQRWLWKDAGLLSARNDLQGRRPLLRRRRGCVWRWLLPTLMRSRASAWTPGQLRANDLLRAGAKGASTVTAPRLRRPELSSI
jgi:hypothetical protein